MVAPLDEVHEAAANPARRRNLELALANRADEGVGQHGRGALRGARRVVGAQRHGGHRESVQEVERVRKAPVLEIEHQIHLALAIELDPLRAVPMGGVGPSGRTAFRLPV
jgi:hypothetical protein